MTAQLPLLSGSLMVLTALLAWAVYPSLCYDFSNTARGYYKDILPPYRKSPVLPLFRYGGSPLPEEIVWVAQAKQRWPGQ